MTPPVRSAYKASCSVGEERVIAHFTFDKKNNSIHMHFYGETFGKKKTPIQVHRADIKFPEGKDTDLVRQILAEYSPAMGIQVNRITKLDTKKSMPEGYPKRIIVRYQG